jgi:hypothetical protein
VRTEPASVPVSFRPPGCSPTTDLARFGSAVQRLSRAASRSVTGLAVLVPIAVRRASDSVPRLTAHVCFAASGAGRVAPCGDGRAGPVSAFDHHGPVLPCLKRSRTRGLPPAARPVDCAPLSVMASVSLSGLLIARTIQKTPKSRHHVLTITVSHGSHLARASKDLHAR